MAEVEVVIAECKKIKEGSSAKGPWTLWHILDGNQDKYATFNKDQAELAGTLIGKRAKVTYEENEKGKTVKEIAGPLNGEPQLGTGDYVKGQTAPSDKKSIAAAVALKAAVDTLNHTIPTDATPKVAMAKIQPLADAYMFWLLEKAGLATEEDVPF